MVSETSLCSEVMMQLPLQFILHNDYARFAQSNKKCFLAWRCLQICGGKKCFACSFTLRTCHPKWFLWSNLKQCQHCHCASRCLEDCHTNGGGLRDQCFQQAPLQRSKFSDFFWCFYPSESMHFAVFSVLKPWRFSSLSSKTLQPSDCEIEVIKQPTFYTGDRFFNHAPSPHKAPLSGYANCRNLGENNETRFTPRFALQCSFWLVLWGSCVNSGVRYSNKRAPARSFWGLGPCKACEADALKKGPDVAGLLQ